MVNNYFKMRGGYVVFFDDRKASSVTKAFNKVKAIGVEASIYRPTRIAGPWDQVPIIGHRDRASILRDLASASPEELPNLNNELAQIQAAFAAAGRQVPPQAVAA